LEDDELTLEQGRPFIFFGETHKLADISP